MLRRTPGKPVEFSGRGIHTGQTSVMVVKPTTFGQGVVFKVNGTYIKAVVQNAGDVDRRTDLLSGHTRIMTVEHVLAALSGLGFSDAVVEIQGPEVPFGDGSCLQLAEALQNAGFVEGEEPAPVARITAPLEFSFGHSFYRFLPSERPEIRCEIRYEHPFVPRQVIDIKITRDNFLQQLAPARTYAFFEEVEEVLARGLGKGGSLENVLIIKKHGYMNQARFPDEPVRHKALDLLGDLYLTGAFMGFRIEAFRPGHKANRAAAAFLLKQKEFLI